jgi:hypothetical protein
LYQLVERYYPEFTANLAEQGKYLPKYVEPEFEEFLRCGRLPHCHGSSTRVESVYFANPTCKQ